jgi:hypothetical protein
LAGDVVSKRDAAIYREAARMIAEEETTFSCIAVRDAAMSRESYELTPIAVRYAEMFSPFDERLVSTFDFEPSDRCDEASINHRVIALCLAAAMAETGDL